MNVIFLFMLDMILSSLSLTRIWDVEYRELLDELRRIVGFWIGVVYVKLGDPRKEHLGICFGVELEVSYGLIGGCDCD